MARPTVFHLGTFRFRVKWSVKAIQKHTEDSTAGLSKADEQKVWMRPDMGFDVERETLLHESLHCIFANLRLAMSEEKEERIIGHLAPALLNYIRQNPDLVSYLQETEPEQP